MRQTLAVACLLLLSTATDARADNAAPCQVHVVLFVPSDVKRPTGYQQRIDQIVNYAEAFFEREFKRWGHEKVVMPFRRSAGGHVEVTVMQGKEKASQYKPVTVRAEVMDANRRQNKLDGGWQVWWIMVYAGDPPEKFAGYLGGFGLEIGGWSVCNFDTTPWGRIDPAAQLGSDFLEKLTLKGMLHELGHGFRLPHIGPLKVDNAGNTLMGPTHVNYRRVIPGEDRVYLSQAEAAMLSTHPAFRGLPHDRQPFPKVDVQNMKYAVNSRNNTIAVTGHLRASSRAVYAMVADESDARPGEYWTKTYVGKVAPDGGFEVIVSEPSESKGTLKTWFVFENGAQTGDGKVHGREGGIPKPYTYIQRQWKFQ